MRAQTYHHAAPLPPRRGGRTIVAMKWGGAGHVEPSARTRPGEYVWGIRCIDAQGHPTGVNAEDSMLCPTPRKTMVSSLLLPTPGLPTEETTRKVACPPFSLFPDAQHDQAAVGLGRQRAFLLVAVPRPDAQSRHPQRPNRAMRAPRLGDHPCRRVNTGFLQSTPDPFVPPAGFR